MERNPDVNEQLQKAYHYGIKGAANALSNLFTETPLGSTIRDAVIYGWFLITLALTIVEIYESTQEDKLDWRSIATLVITVTGLIFSTVDVLYISHIQASIPHLQRMVCVV